MRSRNFASVAVMAAVGALLASLSLFVPAAQAATVTIAGDVSLEGSTIQVEAQARGPANALSGSGGDTPVTPPSGVNPGVCRFPLSGSTTGSTVTLSGNVTFSTNHDFIGAPVTITGDSSTGSIVFDFAGFIFTGTGTVVIK